MSNENGTFQLEFSPPSRQSKNYLRRMAKLLNFQRAVQEERLDESILTDMVEFLASYVTNDIPQEQKVEIVWGLSQDKFDLLMQLVQQGAEAEAEEGN